MAEVEIWRGGVAAWECDDMGHLNVGFYVAKSMEGLAGFAAELGMPHAFAPRATATLIVREHYIRFLREARAGAPLAMTGGVVEMGESDARLLLVLRHASGEVAAIFQTVVDHAAAADACVFPWPDRLRARAEALHVEIPAQLAPRSIELGPTETTASGARAAELGLHRLALGVIGRDDCDAFGRMRTETFMAKITNGFTHLPSLRAGERDGRRIGGAALEYRLKYLAWPRAGDRFELRSGVAQADAGVRRIVHWLLDPDSGRAWGAAEVIAAAFDLDARKIVKLSEDELAQVRAGTIAGLGL